ncbi:hypothetical protein BGZ57DRAFT_130811 [Hyaloscypha finlandica]|nr:hypothetical protein BGZ57DRAFT_130811 [Hyaloscypha finlandica]
MSRQVVLIPVLQTPLPQPQSAPEPSPLASPLPSYDDILLAQEAAEDERLEARAREVWQAGQKHSCPADNETTPWIQHTKAPILFRNRPLDIITASTQKPSASNAEYCLGSWQGRPAVSPARNEAQLRVLMRAVDQVFDRAEATLNRTSYQFRCWLHTFHKRIFWPHVFHGTDIFQSGSNSSAISSGSPLVSRTNGGGFTTWNFSQRRFK